MAEIIKVDPALPKPEAIACAAALIRQGMVVGMPTDTVYGLAADPFNLAAAERIFAIKGRSADAPLLLLVDSIEMAAAATKNLPAAFQALARRFWPGPLTVVLEASEKIPSLVTANTGKLGVRLPAAAIPRALVRAVGGPITGTSANLSGQPECRSAGEVDASLGTALPLILDGGPSGDVAPSTVMELNADSWELIREGTIQREELEQFFGGLKSV